MNSLNEADLQDWELLPQEEFVIGSNKQHHEPVEKEPVGLKPSQASKEIESSNTEPCDESVEETQEEFVLGSNTHHHEPLERESVGIKPSQASKEIESSNTEPCDKSVEETQEEFVLGSNTPHHEPVERESVGIKPSQASKEIESSNTEPCDKSVEESDDDGGSLNIWKWSINGIGTICSFGVAAASVCIIILGNHRKNKLQFHIYTNDKRIKNENTRKLDEAISALGGAIVARARVTVGGYYDTTL